MGGGGPNLRTVAGWLLPTPVVNDMGANKTPCWWGEWTEKMAGRHRNGNGHGRSLTQEAMRLVPTPVAQDAKDRHNPSQQARHTPPLSSVAHDLAPTCVTAPDTGNGHARNLGREARALPTPRAADVHASPTAPAARKHVADGFGNLAEVIGVELMPTPDVASATGGHKNRGQDRAGELLLPGVVQDPDQMSRYLPGIRQWERLTRPSPPPTVETSRGNQGLSPEFCTWMMGWPDRWLTGVPGVTRNEAIRMAGNGAVPQQAAAGVWYCLRMLQLADTRGL